MAVCLVCRGNGQPGGCPKCGKVFTMGSAGTTALSPEVLEKHQIPPEYMGITWDANELLHTHMNLKDDARFQMYTKQLTKLMELFKSGIKVNQSAIIIAGAQMGKMAFAYTCLKYALEAGFSVAPILDNTQIRRLNVLSADKPYSSYIKDLGISIEDLVNTDVVFMVADKDNPQSALPTYESLLDKRARRGRATFLLSRFSLQKMSPYGYDSDGIVNRDRSYNTLKYPVIVRAFKEMV